MEQPMRVERCSGCGARYNVSRLATGAEFTCRRCGLPVRVGGEPTSIALEPSRLALLAAALGLGVGAALSAWPWETLPGYDPWWLGGTALACLLFAARPSLLTAWLVGVPALYVLLRTLGTSDALALGPPRPGVTLAALALAAGAVARGLPRRSRVAVAARLLGIGGALGLLASLAVAPSLTPPYVSDLLVRSRALAEGVRRFGAVRAGDALRAFDVSDALWAGATCFVLLASVWPARRADRVGRYLARVGLLLFSLAVLVPFLARGWEPNQGSAYARWGRGLAVYFGTVVLLAHVAWAHGAWALGPGRETSSRGTGPWHATTAVGAGLALAWTAPIHAAEGFAAIGWGDAAVARVLLWGLLGVAALACLFARPLRRGGALPLLAASLALLTTTPGLLRWEVPRSAVPVLLAAAAGAAWSRRGVPGDRGVRAAVGAVGATILAILLLPGSDADAARRPLEAGLAAWRRGVEVGISLRAALDPSLVALGLALAGGALALLVALAGPRRLLTTPFVLLVVLFACYPALHAGATVLETPGRETTEALRWAWLAAGSTFLTDPGPAVVGTLAAAADAWGRAAARDGASRG